MVDVCGLVDLGFEGRRWTYEKNVAGGSYCHVRLDRALACADWSAQFLLVYVRHLTRWHRIMVRLSFDGISDHRVQEVDAEGGRSGMS